MSFSDVFKTDLVLLHAPSVYDFRKRVVMHGPIADAVPSGTRNSMSNCIFPSSARAGGAGRRRAREAASP
jgi:hypothetical protein